MKLIYFQTTSNFNFVAVPLTNYVLFAPKTKWIGSIKNYKRHANGKSLGAINLPNFVRCRFWSNTAFPHVFSEIIVQRFGSHRIPGRSVRSVKRMRTENECKTWHAHDSHGRWKCTEVTADQTVVVSRIECCVRRVLIIHTWVTGMTDGGRIWFSHNNFLQSTVECVRCWKQRACAFFRRYLLKFIVGIRWSNAEVFMITRNIAIAVLQSFVLPVRPLLVIDRTEENEVAIAKPKEWKLWKYLRLESNWYRLMRRAYDQISIALYLSVESIFMPRYTKPQHARAHRNASFHKKVLRSVVKWIDGVVDSVTRQKASRTINNRERNEEAFVISSLREEFVAFWILISE